MPMNFERAGKSIEKNMSERSTYEVIMRFRSKVSLEQESLCLFYRSCMSDVALQLCEDGCLPFAITIAIVKFICLL
jgi:hypothetical protein